jgi:hypothetical protein
MAMSIPSGARMHRDHRLTLLRAILDLADDRGFLQTLKREVKAALEKRHGERAVLADKSPENIFAESDLAVARYQPPWPAAEVIVEKVHAMVGQQLSLKQFLSACSISADKLKPFLSGNQIESVSRPLGTRSGALVVEWKPGTKVDLDAIAAALLAEVKSIAEAA